MRKHTATASLALTAAVLLAGCAAESEQPETPDPAWASQFLGPVDSVIAPKEAAVMVDALQALDRHLTHHGQDAAAADLERVRAGAVKVAQGVDGDGFTEVRIALPRDFSDQSRRQLISAAEQEIGSDELEDVVLVLTGQDWPTTVITP